MRYGIAVVVMCAVGVGCGGKKEAGTQESLAKRAGSSLGGAATEFAAGLGAGADTKLLIPVELSDDLKAKGLSKTVAKALGVGESHKGFTVYVTSGRAFEGELIARAYDKEGLEIGRSRSKVAFGADDAKYVTFTFDDEMDSNLVGRYGLSAAAK